MGAFDDEATTLSRHCCASKASVGLRGKMAGITAAIHLDSSSQFTTTGAQSTTVIVAVACECSGFVGKACCR